MTSKQKTIFKEHLNNTEQNIQPNKQTNKQNPHKSIYLKTKKSTTIKKTQKHNHETKKNTKSIFVVTKKLPN